MKRKLEILETTLRDGSYVNNFSFTVADTEKICRELEELGFQLIEVGHGVGLNASNAGKGKAVATDEEYMIAASKSLKVARWGMFCIPGIARLEDIDLAAKHGMGFIRIGTNVTEVHSSKPFVERAKKHGMFVMANFMKSYVLPPKQFAQKVKLSESYGTDLVYLVDSAGGMFPYDIKAYYQAIRKVSQIPLGFHGHDNLGFANANSLIAAELGFALIDTSLQGLGRSSGNACTETMVASLMKQGYKLNIDFLKLLSVGRDVVQLLPDKGKDPLDIVSGHSDFHSSYMPKIHLFSAKYGINPLILIMELCKIDKVNAPDELLELICKRLNSKPTSQLGKFDFRKYVGGEQDHNK